MFDVQLDIQGNTVDESEPMAIMLVLYYSASMKDNQRVEYMRTGVNNFLDAINNAGLGRTVSVGVVGYSRESYALFSEKIALYFCF